MSRLLPFLACAFAAACNALPNQGTGVALRIDRAVIMAPADPPYLVIDGALVNTGERPFTNGGCLRPGVAIDSLGAGVWVLLETLQSDDLVTCVRAFTVDPGQTATFTTQLSRPRRLAFPTGVILRARIATGNSQYGPSAEFTLPR